MSATLTIDVIDRTPEIFNRLMQLLSGEQLNKAVGFTAQETVRSHLSTIEQDSVHHEHRGLGGQSIGGERTHFYEQAAQQTSFTSDDAAAIVGIAKTGMAQRYYGGPIDPVNATWLTIPNTAETYGHRASEFDMYFVKFHDNLAALFPRGKKIVKGEPLNPYFWLKKHVDQQGDKTVLPDADKIRSDVREALTEYFSTLKQ